MIISVRSYIADKNYDLDVDPKDTIRHVREEIQKQESVPIEKLRLIFNGKDLRNATGSVADWNMKDNCVVHLALLFKTGDDTPIHPPNKTAAAMVRPPGAAKVIPADVNPRPEEKTIQLLVKLFDKDNRTIVVNIRPSDYILTLKQRIQDEEPTEVPEYQRIIFGGKPLEDHFQVQDYGMKNGSNLTMAARLKGGSARLF